jgi:hypothetical protein
MQCLAAPGTPVVDCNPLHGFIDTVPRRVGVPRIGDASLFFVFQVLDDIWYILRPLDTTRIAR